MVTRLKERTRGGQGAKTPGGNASDLKPLSDSYIKQRANDPKLSSETSPSTSNLTRYGGMLDSLFYKVVNSSVIVSLSGSENIAKAIYTSRDRPWVNVTRADATAIQKLVERMIKDNINK